MATRVAAAGGGNWTTGATWVGGVAPTAADDAQLTVASGNITIDAGSVARSLDCTGYVGTLTHTAAVTLTLGDATAGLSNIAIKLVAGMTYTLGNVATSAITFASTSATQQTVDFGGKTHGNITFGTSGTPSYAVASAMSCGATATVTSTFGHFAFDGVSNTAGLTHTIGKFAASASNVRTINLGACNITLTGAATYWNMGSSNNITLVCGTSSITSTGGLTAGTSLSFTTGNKTYNKLSIQGPSENSVIVSTLATSTFSVLERVGPADPANYNQITFGFAVGTVKVTGTFKAWGDDETKRLQIWPNSNGLAARLDLAGATLDLKYVNFQDIIFSNGGANLDLSTVTGGSSDNGGNTIIGGGSLIFTPAATQTWQTTGAGSWSDVSKWTSRIPLGQDPVIFNSAFVGSPTIACDMAFSCGSLTVAGSGNITLRADRTITNIVGSFTGRSGLSMTASSLCSWYLNARKQENIDSSSTSWVSSMQLSSANGGIYTLTSNIILSALQHRAGPIEIPSSITLSAGSYVSNATNAQAMAIVNLYGKMILASTGTVLSLVQGAAFTKFNDFGGVIQLTNTAAGAKSFQGSGNPYPLVTVAPNGAGAFNFTGSNTFPQIPKPYSPGTATITLAAGTTTTITSPGNDGFGNGANVVSLKSSVGASPATISKAGGLVNADYLSLQDIAATGGAVFNAGANSTNVSGNTGWAFTAANQWIPQAMLAA